MAAFVCLTLARRQFTNIGLKSDDFLELQRRLSNMRSDSAVSFQMPITIEDLDIDHMGHVNNAVYLSWAQRIAIDFWNAKATPEMINSRLWVARNHNIEYYKPAFFGDALSGFLTFKEYKGIRVLFHIEIMRGHDVLARVQSWWCSVDATTHRPAAIAKSFLENLVARPG